MGISSQPEGQLIRVELRLTVGEQTVPALFFVPREEGDPMPLVLIQHPATGSKDDYFVADIARMWASRGWICGGFDAPFHGDRVPNDPMSIFRDRDSYPQLIDQFGSELTAVVDDVASRFPVDMNRLGFVGYSLGSMLGLGGVASDGRFKAAAFCLVGEGGMVGSTSDEDNAAHQLNDVAVRIVGKSEDELIPRAATEALFNALPGKKDIVWLPGGHYEIGPDVTSAAGDWLRDNL